MISSEELIKNLYFPDVLPYEDCNLVFSHTVINCDNFITLIEDFINFFINPSLYFLRISILFKTISIFFVNFLKKVDI